MRKLCLSCRFETPQELKDQLCGAFCDQIGDTDELEFGYILPGHGAQGKQQWIVEAEDLRDMYEDYKGKKEIIMCRAKTNILNSNESNIPKTSE